jgi:sugar/nucleoside kinase (ribokinase family)
MLAILGHTSRDFVDGCPARAGGVPLYAARAVRALGEQGLVVTRCAAEDATLLAPVRALGLPVVWRPESVSATFRLTYDGREREVRIEALGESWLPEDAHGWLGRAIGRADWVLAGALWRGDFPAETLAVLARGRRLALDGQGLVRPAALGRVEHDAAFDPAALAHVDVLHVSEDEASVLGLGRDAASLGSLGVPEVVVTLGDQGSLILAHGHVEHVQARPFAGADPTGAGDAFMGAYLVSRGRGHSPLSAARRATTVVRSLLEGRLS